MQSRRINKLGFIVVLGALATASCWKQNETRSPQIEPKDTKVVEMARGTSIGQIAPDFDLETSSGDRISLKDLNGIPAVIVFWTAWCPACKDEAPKVNRLAAEFQPRGVKVVGINIGESDARIAEGIKDFGIKYAVAKDRDTSVSKNYKVIGTPTVIILDRNGAVQYFGNELPADYADKLNQIL